MSLHLPNQIDEEGHDDEESKSWPRLLELADGVGLVVWRR
jgi:hypothetical protein